MEPAAPTKARFKIDKAEPGEFGISWYNYTVFERKQGFFGPYWEAVKNFDDLPDARDYVKCILNLPEYYG